MNAQVGGKIDPIMDKPWIYFVCSCSSTEKKKEEKYDQDYKVDISPYSTSIP